ncbi:MAG: Uma2 family endonuclease [bacterium]
MWSRRGCTYPDVTVICGKPEAHAGDRQSVSQPQVVFEVLLSPATEAYDRGAKFGHYRRIPVAGRVCARVAGSAAGGAHFRRTSAGTWELRECRRAGEVALLAVGCSLSLDEIYEGSDDFEGGDGVAR